MMRRLLGGAVARGAFVMMRSPAAYSMVSQVPQRLFAAKAKKGGGGGGGGGGNACRTLSNYLPILTEGK
jgi:hypothetical protein